jgi:GTP cyclohydrolase I
MTYSVTNQLLTLLDNSSIPFKANDNISQAFQLFSSAEKDAYLQEVENAVQNLLHTLLIDTETDHNTKDSARRIAKYYVNEIFKGRYIPEPNITTFPNARQLDELYTVGPITVRSMCSHHFAPITGKCWIGIFPGTTVSGLSKFNRIVDWVASRPQIQEEMTVQIADYIEEKLQPKGLAVLIKSSHLCMTLRGVKDNDTLMTTSVIRGCLRDPGMKEEFLSLIQV